MAALAACSSSASSGGRRRRSARSRPLPPHRRRSARWTIAAYVMGISGTSAAEPLARGCERLETQRGGVIRRPAPARPRAGSSGPSASVRERDADFDRRGAGRDRAASAGRRRPSGRSASAVAQLHARPARSPCRCPCRLGPRGRRARHRRAPARPARRSAAYSAWDGFERRDDALGAAQAVERLVSASAALTRTYSARPLARTHARGRLRVVEARRDRVGSRRPGPTRRRARMSASRAAPRRVRGRSRRRAGRRRRPPRRPGARRRGTHGTPRSRWSAADAGDDDVGQAPRLREHLRAGLAADHRLQLAHERGVGVRPAADPIR